MDVEEACSVGQPFAILRSLKREVRLVRFDARATSSPARAIPLTAVIRFEIILESG